MATTTFDTLRYAKRLKEAGFTEQQAEVQAEARAEILEGELATKRDIAELKAELKRDIAEGKAETVRWMAGMLVAQAALIAALVKLL